MPLSAAELNRTTLGRQLLLERARVGAVEAVRQVVALQAQRSASPYLALWSRVADFDAADLDDAFGDGDVVKATLMRATLHAVTREDYPAFHLAGRNTVRAGRLGDPRFAAVGLTDDQVDALIAHVVRFAHVPRSNADLVAEIERRAGPLPAPGAWWALRLFAPVLHAPTGGPWQFGDRPAYRSAGPLPDVDPACARQTMIRRVLQGFGPASLADLAQFLKAPRAPLRATLDAMPDLARLDGPAGSTLYDVADGPRWPGRTPAPPRLLPMWDSVLLAYADRSRVVPAAFRPLVIRRNGDVLACVLVDGHVAGVWRPLGEGIEVTAFRRFSTRVWSGLRDEAAGLVAFLADRDPDVYRHYRHWWPVGEDTVVRVLP